MTEQTIQEAYIESCLIDLSKQLTAAEKRIEALEAALHLYACNCPKDYCEVGDDRDSLLCGYNARAALGMEENDAKSD